MYTVPFYLSDHCIYYLSSIAAKCKDMTVSGMLISMNSTVDMIKSAVAGHVDVRVMRADLNERYLPGLSNMVRI